jgi:Transposase/HipA-like C-terminal domain
MWTRRAPYRLAEDGRALIIDRFDLRMDGTHRGFEDFCVLNARRTEEKHRGSYETSVMKRFGQFANSTHVAEDLEKLFTLIALNCALRNGDQPGPGLRTGAAFWNFHGDLHEMARWLVEKGVRSVAIQSTSVCWMPVLEILEQHGLEVYLVNAQHTKNLPGRKSDVEECQWLLKLHAFGLLNNSYQPSDEIRIARTRWRQRGNLVAEAASAIQRMQKVLIEMNIQLGNVLSGVSGMTILGAILQGERDPWILASLVQAEVQAPRWKWPKAWKETGERNCCSYSASK